VKIAKHSDLEARHGNRGKAFLGVAVRGTTGTTENISHGIIFADFSRRISFAK
jgi:hypothetical protein